MLDAPSDAAYPWQSVNLANKVALMEIVLRKYGNSTVAVLPPGVLRDLGLAAGQAMTLNTTPGGQIILAPQRRYALADLIAQCDPDALPPADMAGWDAAPPVGGEAW